MRSTCYACDGPIEFKKARAQKLKDKPAYVSFVFHCNACDKLQTEHVPVFLIKEAMEAIAEFEEIFGAAE